ncbi:MAG: hypothetical protein AAGJ90_13960 [Pseudomonadota bacterium]
MSTTVQLTNEEEKALQAFEIQHHVNRRAEKVTPLRIQGYEVLCKARLPLHFRARIREMKVGDTFIMGLIRHTYDAEDTGRSEYEGVAEVYVKREPKGLYQLYCNWSMLTKPNRPMTFAHATFKWEKGGIFAFVSENAEVNLRNICLISRFIQRLINSASPEDLQHYEQLGLPYYLVGVNVDKNNLTTLQYWRKSEQSLGRYKFADNQLPKPMMKCIIELGLLTGDIDL